MIQVALSLLLLPLLSAIVTLLFLRKHGNIAALLSVATAGGILAFSSYLIFGNDWIRICMEYPLVFAVKLAVRFWFSY